MQTKITWLAFLIAAAIYSVKSTLDLNAERHAELLRRLTPFRKAFKSGFYTDEIKSEENQDAS